LIVLAGASQITVLFSRRGRHVVLDQGEALFNVRHDPQRPFQVDVGKIHILQIGTEFDVRRYREQNGFVSVTHGVVAVSKQPDASSFGIPSQPIKVTTGTEVEFDAKGEIGPPQQVDISAVTAWLFGRRVYRDAPLARVIEDLQLYSSRPIEIDPMLGLLSITGAFDDLHRAEEWVRRLPRVLPVEVDDSGPQLHIRCIRPGCQ